MLVDVKFRRPDATMAYILGTIGGGSVMPERIGEGMYLTTHWSIDQLGVKIRERWREKEWTEPSFEHEYGVCDTPEQTIEKLKLREAPERVFVSFVRIRRDEQPSSGGWRWHKWGEYIGDREPTSEYIYHEREIEEVYTFHVYELAETAAA